LHKATALQDGLIAYATGKPFEETEYQDLRRNLLAKVDLKGKVPQFVREIRDLRQFWSFIKEQSSNYAGRREFIWDQFRPLIDHLEGQDVAPGVAPITVILEAFALDHVHAIWQKALYRIPTIQKERSQRPALFLRRYSSMSWTIAELLTPKVSSFRNSGRPPQKASI
jgi:hypothetical protein